MPPKASATAQASMLRCMVLPFMDLPSRSSRDEGTRLPATASCDAAGPVVCSIDVRPLDASSLPAVLLCRLRPRECAVMRKVFVGTAHPQFEREQPLEAVAHIQFVGHAHAAVQLDRFLADLACRLADHDLCAGHRL